MLPQTLVLPFAPFSALLVLGLILTDRYSVSFTVSHLEPSHAILLGRAGTIPDLTSNLSRERAGAHEGPCTKVKSLSRSALANPHWRPPLTFQVLLDAEHQFSLRIIDCMVILSPASRAFLWWIKSRRSTVISSGPRTYMELSTAAVEAEDRKGTVHHDTHATPPMFIQKEHWRYQTMKRADLESDAGVVDLRLFNQLSALHQEKWKAAGVVPASRIQSACEAYNDNETLSTPVEDAPYYEHCDFPGLHVISGLLPPETQVLFTSCLMHRDLADAGHKINLQADFNIPYPVQNSTQWTHKFASTFFSRERASTEDLLIPKVPEQQKPLNNEQFLYSKLRWLTLGEQYDWPTRSYAKHATSFPVDLSKLVTGLFPHIRPESGVVLIYSAKDFMPVHRDVSEQCQRALASFSVGCDGIFILGRGEDDGEGPLAPRTVAIRVRSGDCIHLDGEARWAWHAMARTIPGTCPSFLASWPVGTPGATVKEERFFKKWKGYMATKRINVSCRQVWD